MSFASWAAREGLYKLLVVDTVPLWAMVGLACASMTYSTFRSAATANDIRFNLAERGDVLYDDPVVVEKSDKYYMTGILTQLSKIKNYPQVLPTPFKFEIEKPVTSFTMNSQMVEPNA